MSFWSQTKKYSSNAMNFWDENLVSIKILYILMNLEYYTCYYFRTKFLTEAFGINEKSFGGFAAVISVLIFFASFIWPRIADNYKIHKWMLLGLAVSSTCVFFTLKYIPSDWPRFVPLFIMGCYILLSAAMPPLLDRQVLKTLEHKGYSKVLYSRQRLWATIAYGSVTFIIGHLISLYGYDAMFISLGIFTALFVPYGIFVVKSYNEEDSQSLKEKDVSSSIETGGKSQDKPKPSVISLLKNFDYLFFLLVILINGFCRFYMSFFLAVYLQDKTGVSMNPTQSATSANIGLILEIIMFIYGKKLVDTLGVYWMLVLGQLVMTVRLWGYYIIPSSPSFHLALYAVELLKGANMGFIQPTAVKLSDHYAPRGLEGTCQGIFNGVFMGLGGFTAGIYVQLFGGNTADISNFKVNLFPVSVISTIGLALFFVKYSLVDRVISLPFLKSSRKGVQ